MVNEKAENIEVIETQTQASHPGVGPENEAGIGSPPAEPLPQTDEEKARIAHELEVKLQPIMLDAALNGISNLLANLTKMPEMAFSKAAHDALVAAWTPLLPMVSPWTNAIIVSIIILGEKGLYWNGHRVKKTDKSGLPDDTTGPKESKPSAESRDLKPAN